MPCAVQLKLTEHASCLTSQVNECTYSSAPLLEDEGMQVLVNKMLFQLLYYMSAIVTCHMTKSQMT